MRSAGPAEPRALTSWPVLVAVVAVVIVTVAAVTFTARAQIRSRLLDGAVAGAAVLSSVVIDRSLTLTDIARGMNPVNRSELNADVILLKRHGEVAGLTIWSLPTGRLVYSDVDAGETVTPRPNDLARAQAGSPFLATNVADPKHADDLVVYHPYDANGDGTMDAVAEVVLPRQEVEDSLTRSTWLLYGAGLIVLLLATAGILQVRRHQVRQDHATVHDALTGLGNRLLLRRVSPPVLSSATADSPAALLLIDLDNFKAVNDTLGHHAGDELLVAVATMIQQESGPSSIAVRLGGDEFAVLMPRASDRGAAREVPRRIRNAVRRPLTIVGTEIQVDASVGMAWAPADGFELSDLMRSADMAMYRAKHSGDGIAEYAQVVATKPPKPAATTVPQLSRALADHQLELFYQPVRGADSAVSSVEALARWRHPEQGLLEASMFIPAVAHTSLMSTLTEWVLREAARQCAQWRASGLNVKVSVNVSTRSLYSDSLPDLVHNLMETCHLPLTALGLEVTEAIFVRDSDRAIPAMQRLHNAGVDLCLDNFGAAYGAVSAIADAPVQSVKIDKRFSGSVVDSPLAKTLVGGWVNACHQLDLSVVAQGVETPSTWRCLIDLGCDGVQGYGICRPMPAPELTQWLAGSHASLGIVVSERGGEVRAKPDPRMADG